MQMKIEKNKCEALILKAHVQLMMEPNRTSVQYLIIDEDSCLDIIALRQGFDVLENL